MCTRRPSSKWALAQAAERGVRIRILTDGDETDAKIVKYASRDAYDQLMTEGIAVYEYRPRFEKIRESFWSFFGEVF